MWSSKRGSSAPTTPCNHAFEERQAEATRSRLKTWLRSPRIPARRLGQVDFSVREAALAVGMSPAREPPGTSPGSPSGAFLTERTVDELRDHEPADATTVRREGNSARRDGATLEATVAESVDSRLQVVEEALLELNQDLLAATSQLRQLQARCETSVVTDFEKVFGGTPQLQIETRLLALEDFCGKSEAQSKELHTLCLALDQRAAGLDQDLTCVVEEVESRLKRMSEHLTTTQVEIRESLRCSPREPKSSPSSLLPWKDWPTSAGEALQVQDKQTTWSIEELQQALLVMQKQMSTFAAELNDAKSGAEQVQQALQQAKERSTFSEADTTKHGSNTETSKQVLTDVQKQMSSFDAELKDARKGAEEMWQALQEVKWKTTCANADQTISGMTEPLQQALTEIQKQMGSLHVELKDTKRGSEDMQQALQEMDEKITSTDADAKSVGKSTQRFHQVLTEVQKQMSSLDAEMKEARKDAEGMQQAFQELNEKTIGSEKDSKIAAKSTETLQQALTEIQKQMGSLHVELKDTKRGSEDMQQDLQAVREMTSCTDADAKTIKKRTEKMDQVLTDVQKQINVFNTELEDSRRVAEEWQQALKDIQDKTSFTDADAKTRAKNTEELHQVLGDVQKRMTLFDAELKDARKLTEKMQQDLAEAQSRERSLAQVPPPAKENEAVADLKAVVENLQQEFRGASLRAEVGELQRHMSQLQQAMVEVQERSGQGQDALRGGLDELVQVVEAVRHALCASESEVNELRKASEHCQEVLGATASHGQLEELQKRLVNMEKAMEMNTAKVEEAYQLCMSRGPERRMAPSSQGVEDSERAHAASIDVVAEREALRSSFDESLEEVKAELKLVSFEALSSIEENRCFTAQSCEELHAEVQSLAQRCEEFQAAKEIQGLRGAVTESASEALILNFPEASWPPPEAFEETLRSKLKLDPTMQIRLQQRQPGLAAEVQGSSERLQELQRNWASAEMGELSDDLKVCLALRGSSLASETAGARTDALWIDSILQTFKKEVMKDCKECCEEVAEAKAFLLAEQQKQGQQLRELRKSQEGIQESVGAAAKEWCAGLSELRVALTQDMDSSQRQEDLALQRAGVQESLVQLQGAVSLELGEARRHISEFMEEEAARLQAQPFAELLEASKSQAGELDLVRRQLIETVQDRVDLRRQLLDVCRSSQGAQRSHFEQETQTQRAQLQRRP